MSGVAMEKDAVRRSEMSTSVRSDGVRVVRFRTVSGESVNGVLTIMPLLAANEAHVSMTIQW